LDGIIADSMNWTYANPLISTSTGNVARWLTTSSFIRSSNRPDARPDIHDLSICTTLQLNMTVGKTPSTGLQLSFYYNMADSYGLKDKQ
jgi:hypothetical protein